MSVSPRSTGIKHCCHLSSLTWSTGKRGPLSDFSEGSAEGRRYSTDSDSKSGTSQNGRKREFLTNIKISRLLSAKPLTLMCGCNPKCKMLINNFSLMCVSAVKCLFVFLCSFYVCFLGSLPQRPWRQRPRSSPTPLYQSSLDRCVPYVCIHTHHHHQHYS